MKIKENYLEAIIAPNDSNLGYAFFSNFPIKKSSEHRLGMVNKPLLDVIIEGSKGEQRIVLFHATPALTPEMLKEQKVELSELRQHLQNGIIPTLVMGDLNSTMWTNHYRLLTNDISLINVRRGNGLCPTWPAKLSSLGIPIDQILYNPLHLQASSCRTVIIPDSDHLALIGDFVN